ncbi:helix-turn-helix domain-containing protein [Escherichia coli O4:H2]
MSSKLHGLVWEGCAFTGMILSRVAVMARLADYSNDEGVSWPAIETIRRQIGARSESTVKSAIAELAKEGWLTKEERKVGGRNVSNIYRLNVEKLEAAAAAARESYKPKRKISPAKNDPLTVDPSNIDPSTVDPSNFDGSTVDKKLPIRGAMIDPDPSVLKPDPSDKRSSCPDVSLLDEKQPSPVERFLEKHPDAFELVWQEYPLRAGANPKKSAFSAWKARLREGVPPEAMLDGVRRYARYLAATGKTGTEFVQRATTFFGPDRNFENPWLLPISGTNNQRCVNHISEPDTEIPPGFRG